MKKRNKDKRLTIKKPHKKISTANKKIIILVLMLLLILYSSYIKSKDTGETNTTTTSQTSKNKSEKEEKTDEEIYKEKVSKYEKYFNNTLISLNDKTLNVKIASDITTDSVNYDTTMLITTNTENEQSLYKITYQNYSVATLVNKDEVYIVLLNAKSKLISPIRMYHSTTSNETIKQKLYNQYINVDILNKQLKNSISFNYQSTTEIDGNYYDVIQLKVPKYSDNTITENSTKSSSSYGNDVDTTINGDGTTKIQQSTDTTEKLLLYFNEDTNELYKIEKTINGSKAEITIEDDNSINFTASGSIEEIDESQLSLTLISELNYMKN
jgi:hypothetical protein